MSAGKLGFLLRKTGMVTPALQGHREDGQGQAGTHRARAWLREAHPPRTWPSDCRSRPPLLAPRNCLPERAGVSVVARTLHPTPELKGKGARGSQLGLRRQKAVCRRALWFPGGGAGRPAHRRANLSRETCCGACGNRSGFLCKA